MSRSFGGTSLTTRPPIVIVPPVTCSSPAIDRRAVDLPHPDGPTSTTNSPSAICRLSPSTPSTPPGYAFVTLSRTICATGAHLLYQAQQLRGGPAARARRTKCSQICPCGRVVGSGRLPGRQAHLHHDRVRAGGAQSAYRVLRGRVSVRVADDDQQRAARSRAEHHAH